MEFTQNEKMMSNINTRQHSMETVDILQDNIVSDPVWQRDSDRIVVRPGIGYSPLFGNPREKSPH